MPTDVAKAMSHLALNLARCADTLKITTTQRVVDEDEGLLHSIDQTLSAEQLTRLAQCTLKTPLLDCIKVQAQVTQDDLYKELVRQVTHSADLQQLISTTFTLEQLQSLTVVAAKLPRVLEWLTILRAAFPEHFQQALFCAAMAAVLSHNMGQNKAFQQGAFVAGLCHDLGILCLTQETVDNKTEPEYWTVYQQHPLLAQPFLERIPKLPGLIIRAIAESHERCDGSGYPHQKSAKQLSQLGQILAMSDLLWGLLTVRLWPQGMTLAHARHILHISADAHFRNTYEALVKALKASKLKSELTTPEDQIPALLKQSLLSVDQLNQCYMSLYAMVTALPREHPSPIMAACYHSLAAIHRAVNSAGVLTSEHYAWLQELQQSHISASVGEELESAALFHVALRWELSRLLDNLKYIYHSERTLLKADVVNLLSIGLQGIKDFQQDRLEKQIGLLLW